MNTICMSGSSKKRKNVSAACDLPVPMFTTGGLPGRLAVYFPTCLASMLINPILDGLPTCLVPLLNNSIIDGLPSRLALILINPILDGLPACLVPLLNNSVLDGLPFSLPSSIPGSDLGQLDSLLYLLAYLYKQALAYLEAYLPASLAPMLINSTLKGIDRPFGGRVKSRLIRSLLINWRLGNFFSSF
jgi:hypothetical protein